MRAAALPAALRGRFWLDFDRSWSSWVIFRTIFFGLHAIDAVLQLAHAPRYGAGGFNVPQLPLPFMPDPTRTGMAFVYGALAIAFGLIALGVAVRWLLPLAATLYAYAYFVSQLDSYQHHYLMCLVLLLACFVPTAPTSIGADGRRWLRSWALRLVLVQLGIVYLWAAVAKIEGPWLDGTLLQLQLQPGTMRTIVAGLGFATVAKLVLATEATLAVTVWNRATWWLALPLGVGLHVGIALIDLEIGLFSYYMIAAYVLVLPPAATAAVGRALGRAVAPLARIPTAATLLAATAALIVGVVLVARNPLPLGWATALGVAMIVGAAVAGRRGGLAALARTLGAGAAALALVATVLASTDVAADHFRTWAGASRRLGLPSERAGYEGLLAVDSDSEYAHFYLGQLDLKAGATEAARAHFAAGQRGAPTRVRCYLAEAAVLASTGQRDDAIATLERGLARVPGDPELRQRLAALRGGGGQ
ncbi:MAG: HTTM domain-containing protein [Myxococcales bacterium]|nr:HTTM domain-containing protein [Myxococcales bacterium]